MEIEYMEDYDLCTGHYAWSFPYYQRNSKKQESDIGYENSKAEIKKRVHDYITHSYQKRHGIFMATLIHSQHSAIDALKELGAEHSDWIVKLQHPDTKVAVFWIDIHKYNVKHNGLTPHKEAHPEMYKEGSLYFYEG